ncbi:hypothetical protein QC764_608610 [Podospora pseudoanserina]|uniref:Pesticidal crystal protein N-terminal domain-containing protein n=1 Tax=Podospora pseudoanserina TaxID=2609844 RepID=A0ABR0HV00_9PEZI|nr:hypothetical protein QC764_608610 [Podospora pseudoanserina]
MSDSRYQTNITMPHSTTHQQPFIMVPTRQYYQSPDTFLLNNIVDINKLLKTAVSSSLKAVPAVGSLLGSVVSALWPEKSQPTLQWDRIEKDVRRVVEGLLDKDKANTLRQKIDSLHDLIDGYNKTAYGGRQKGEKLTFLLGWFTVTRREFTENGTPWLTLQYFVPLATLHLTLLREQLLRWDKLYPDDTMDEVRLRRELQDAITIYTTAAEQIRDKCLKWRMDERIIVTEDEAYDWCLVGRQWRKFVRDLETQFSQTISWGPEIGPSRGYRIEEEVNRYVQDLRDTAGAVYRQQIDDILAPSLQWPQFDKVGTYDPVRRVIMAGTTGPMCAGISSGMWHFNDREFAREHGPITKVVVHAWDRVDGFEVWYGGVSSGLRGRRGGSQRELEVGDSGVNCHAGQWLDSVSFFVSPNKHINGGNGTDNFRIGFAEDCPSNETDTLRLDYVYGWSNSGSGFIEGFGAVFCRVEIM